MAGQIPQVRKHATGVWFVRWNGRDHYFSKDEQASRDAFEFGDHPGSLSNWIQWRSNKRRQQLASNASNRISVVDLSERFLQHYVRDGRPKTIVYFRSHLTRFVATFGAVCIQEIDTGALRSFREDLMRLNLSPKTVGHDLTAVKTMLRWAAEEELITPLNLKAIKPPKTRAPTPVRLEFSEVCRWMRAAARHEPRLLPYLALNYLCVARPSEVIRLVRGEGDFEPAWVDRGGHRVVEPRGVFVFHEWKTENRTSYPRHLVLTDQALAWLDASSPVWNRLDSYSARVRDLCGSGGPSLLRKAGAWHLQLQGVELADIRLLLGHMPSGAWRNYVQIEWSALRERASRISI